MIQQKEDTAIRTIFEIINSDGMDGLGDAVSILIDEAMKVERSSALEKGIRSEKALTLAMAEMYVQGVSEKILKYMEKIKNKKINPPRTFIG